MGLAKYYSSQRALAYHPVGLGERRGLARLISFDDRFEVVVNTLEKLIGTSRLKILDIGVGDGIYEKSLSSKGISAEFYGVDISQQQLDRAKKVLKVAKKVDLDEAKLPFPDNFFDIVIVSEVLEHLIFPEKALSEAARILKPGGYLVITYPTSGSWQLRLALLFSGASPLLNYPKNREHIRFFNKKDILEMLPLRVVKFRGLGSLLFDKWNFPVRIITPRLLEIIGNKFFPNFALGNLLILEK